MENSKKVGQEVKIKEAKLERITKCESEIDDCESICELLEMEADQQLENDLEEKLKNLEIELDDFKIET